MNFNVSKIPEALKECVDRNWAEASIYNHYNSPIEFMEDVISQKDKLPEDNKNLIAEGITKYNNIKNKDDTYNTKFEDVATKVKAKLLARGFTTQMLYSKVEFTAENTGVASKQRMMLGRKDFFFKNPNVADGKLFHDIVINMSYPWTVSDATIEENSYALYALTRELSRVVPIRVIVVNHTGS